jgi:hypothetical protein
MFQTVPDNAETLIEWAEHLFRYLFQTHVAAGAFMPSQESGTEHLFLGGVPLFRLTMGNTSPIGIRCY